MNANQLYNYLSGMKGGTRRMVRVCIDKRTFAHSLEQDGCVILEVEAMSLESVPLMDGDGFMALRKDGTERYFQALVLRGGHQ